MADFSQLDRGAGNAPVPFSTPGVAAFGPSAAGTLLPPVDPVAYDLFAASPAGQADLLGQPRQEPTAFQRRDIRYADPVRPAFIPSFVHSSDPLRLDPDEFGTKTAGWGQRTGLGYGSDYVAGLNVFGRAMSRDQLLESEAGRELLDLAERNRTGKRRSFIDALRDVGVGDLPFVGMLASVGKSFADARMVFDAMKKLQDGEPVTDEELLKTRLYMEEEKYRSQGTWGATVGDIVRQAPGFMLEFLGTGFVGGAVRQGISKLTGGSIHWSLNSATKILARESAEAALEKTAAKATEKAASSAAEKVATTAVENIVKEGVNGAAAQAAKRETSELLFRFMKFGEGADFYKGMTDDMVRSLADKRAAHEVASLLASRSSRFRSFLDWSGRHMFRGMFDYGAWGAEEATVLYTGRSTAGRALADAAGILFIESPLKGGQIFAVKKAVQRGVIDPIVGERTVGDSALSLRMSALQQGNRELMDDAESIALGMDLMEYVSETAGPAFGSLGRAAGLGLEKLGVKGLVRPVARAVGNDGLPVEGLEAVTIGGRIRKFIEARFGTRETLRKKVEAEKTKYVARALGAAASDMTAVEQAVAARSASFLPPALRAKVTGDFESFANAAVKKAYDVARRAHDQSVKDLAYKNYARYALANYMAKKGIGPQSVSNLFQRMGYDGVLGEMLEERYGDVIKGMLGWDDRETHDFISNAKEAIKGLFPSWDQLTAEAVGFSVPMVTRSLTMRAMAKIGGEGPLMSVRNALSVVSDAMRHDQIVEATPAMYKTAHDAVQAQDRDRAAEIRTRASGLAAGSEERTRLERQAEELEKVVARRQERYDAMSGSLEEVARRNADQIVAIPVLSDATLADDAAYKLASDRTLEQAASIASGRVSIVEFAPRLARHLATIDGIAPGESIKWYRRAAHKIVGLAGAIVTGDFSLAQVNPASWLAADAGLPRDLVQSLKQGFLETYREELERMSGDAARSGGSAFDLSREDVMDAAEAKFAPVARRMMASHLAVHQLRTLSDTSMWEEAAAYVAENETPEDGRRWHKSTDASGAPVFYKMSADGSGVDESSKLTLAEFRRAYDKEVRQAHNDIAVATVAHLAKSTGADTDAVTTAVMSALSVDRSSPLLASAASNAALRLIGRQGDVLRTKADVTKPLSVALRASAAGEVSSDVVSYVSSADEAGQVDDLVYESMAQSLGLSFDGTEEGLRKRNLALFSLAKVLSLRRESGERWTKEVALDDAADRETADGTLEMTLFQDSETGRWKYRKGYKTDGTEDTAEFATYEEAAANLREDGYEKHPDRFTVVRKQVVETEDMFWLLRQLNLVPQYKARIMQLHGSSAGVVDQKYLHPLLRREEDGSYSYAEDEAEAGDTGRRLAQDVLEEELEAARRGENADPGTRDRMIYDAVLGKQGYVTVGERLLMDHGVTFDTLKTYAGDASAAPSKRTYTLSLNAGRVGGDMSTFYVAFDPSSTQLGPTLLAPAVEAVCLDALTSSPDTQRLIADRYGTVVSDFFRQLDGLLAAELDKVRKGEEGKRDVILEANIVTLRRLVAGVDRVVEGPDGKLRVARGAGVNMSALAFVMSQVCLFHAEKVEDASAARAWARVVENARQTPAYLEFLNLTDLVLGGNGFLAEAVRSAARGEEDPNAQRGVMALMTWAAMGDASAFRQAARTMAPGGMSYTSFLDIVVRKLDAMVKSGVPGLSEEEKAELRRESRAAAAAAREAAPEIRSQIAFVGHVIGVVKRALNSGKAITSSVSAFFHEVARDALQDPGVTEEQRRALESMLAAADHVTVAEEYEEKYRQSEEARRSAEEERDRLREELAKKTDAYTNAAAQATAAAGLKDTMEEQAAGLARRLDAVQASVDEQTVEAEANKKRKIRKRVQERLDRMQARVDEARDALATARDQMQEARNAVAAAEKAVRKSTRTARTAKAVMETRTPTVSAVATQANMGGGQTLFRGKGFKQNINPFRGEEDNSVEADGTSNALPDQFNGLFDPQKRRDTMRFGVVASEDHPITRSAARLAANLVVRTAVSLAEPAGDGSRQVSETSFRDTLHMLLPGVVGQPEVEEAIVTAFRYVDDMRARAGFPAWDDFVQPGARWDFGDGSKDEEDVSSENFNNQALDEYNSEAITDFLALVRYCSSELSGSVQAFLSGTRADMRSLAADPASMRLTEGETDAVEFVNMLVNPRMDPAVSAVDAQNAALQVRIGEVASASSTEARIRALLSPGRKFPVSRRAALYLTYLSSLNAGARYRFGMLAGNSVAATPLRIDANGVMRRAPSKSFGSASDSIIVDAFPFVGASESRIASAATLLEEAERRLLAEDAPNRDKIDRIVEGTAAPDVVKAAVEARLKAVADAVAEAFGHESPFVSALRSLVVLNRLTGGGTLGATIRGDLVGSLFAAEYNQDEERHKNPRIHFLSPLVTVLHMLQATAKAGGVTRAAVSALGAATFAMDDLGRQMSLREVRTDPSRPSPLYTVLSMYMDSLPETVRTAEVDPRRDSRGSSVVVAPRDLVPMLARWLYASADEMLEVRRADGTIVKSMSFEKIAMDPSLFPGMTKERLMQCRQDAVWPDGTPICAKCLTATATVPEVYDACAKAFLQDQSSPYWFPLFPGDHSTLTLVQIPRSVDLARLQDVAGSMQAAEPVAKVDYNAALEGTPEHARAKDLSKMKMANRFIGYGVEGSSTARYAAAYARAGLANTGNYGPGTVAFVSVNGSRKDVEGSTAGVSADQIRTYSEALYAITRGATLVTDGFAYSASSSFNTGERRLREVLTLAGAVGEQVDVDGGTVTRWTMPEDVRQAIASSGSVADLLVQMGTYGQIQEGDSSFAGVPVVWEETQGDHAGFAWLDRAKGVVHICMSAARDAFAKKAWLSPKRSSPIPEADRKIRTFDDLLQFAALHEVAHTQGTWFRETDRVKHEDWANSWAVRRMGTYREDGTKAPPASRITSEMAAAFAVSDRDRAIAASAAASTYESLVNAASAAVGVPLMTTEAKRSALSSMEAQGASMTGVRIVRDADGNETTESGKFRVKVVRSFADPTGKNETLKGNVFLDGYGATALKRLAKDGKSSLLKAHFASTSGEWLFFAKALSLATAEDTGEFLEGTANAVLRELVRTSDGLDSTLVTDYDSYKIGVGSTRGLAVKTATGEKTLMEAVFDMVAEAAGLDADTLSKSAAGDQASQALVADRLSKACSDGGKSFLADAVVMAVDNVRGVTEEKRLSDLMKGVRVDVVDGLKGPALALTYEENGGMAYPVANVSHESRVPRDPGEMTRNYAVDAMTLAMADEAGGWSQDKGALRRRIMDSVANWGVMANLVYTDPDFLAAVMRETDAIADMVSVEGEDPEGQNVREQLARQVWSVVRDAQKLPFVGVDAALVTPAAVLHEGKVVTLTKSRMQQDMMRGSEIFTEDEAKFFGATRRVATFNVNVDEPWFRYTWFLEDSVFDGLLQAGPKGHAGQLRAIWAEVSKSVEGLPRGRQVAKTLAAAFTRLRQWEDARAAAERAGDEAKARNYKRGVEELRQELCMSFVDHHGMSMWDGNGRDARAAARICFDDLFLPANKEGMPSEFDLTAVMCDDADLVFNDATGRRHIALGGTLVGCPRTPSYNGGIWNQCGRAGLPVTEIREKEGEKVVGWRTGRDAMIQPDPYTYEILGCDNDGDKSKVYLMRPAGRGRCMFATPPPVDVGADGSISAEARRRFLDGPVNNFTTWCVLDPLTGEVSEVPETEEIPVGAFRRVTEDARRAMSNSFVRDLFTLARRAPCEAGDGTARVSKNGEPRIKFLGGLVSSHTKARPVENASQLMASAAESVMPKDGKRGNLGDVELASEVAGQGQAASGARAMAVSVASTLHLSWMLGMFTGYTAVSGRQVPGLFRNAGTPEAARQWFQFMYRVDGISNATFDDLKEQICARLGWTKGMMENVVVDLLLNKGRNKLPTTDAEFTEVLSEYARSANSKDGSRHWMLRAVDVTDEEAGDMLEVALGRQLGADAVADSLGIVYKDESRAFDVVANPKTVRQAIMRSLFGGSAESSDMLGALAGDASGMSRRNAVAGYLLHLFRKATGDNLKLLDLEVEKAADGVLFAKLSDGTTIRVPELTARFLPDEAGLFRNWYYMRSALKEAQGFVASFNFLKADPGSDRAGPAAVRQAGSWSRGSVKQEGSNRQPAGLGANFEAMDPAVKSAVTRMRAATRMAYSLAGGLQTVACRAVAAVAERADHLADAFQKRAGAEARRFYAEMLVHDAFSPWDTQAITGSGSQRPYIAGMFRAVGELESHMPEGTPRIGTADRLVTLYRTLAGAAGVMRGGEKLDFTKDVKDNPKQADEELPSVLDFRHSVEALFRVMMERMTTSDIFRTDAGSKHPAYLRMAVDDAYGSQRVYSEREQGMTTVEPYGAAGSNLFRIMPAYRANDVAARQAVKDLADRIITGKAFAGDRSVNGFVNKPENGDRYGTFDLSPENILKHISELTGEKAKPDTKSPWLLSEATLKALDGLLLKGDKAKGLTPRQAKVYKTVQSVGENNVEFSSEEEREDYLQAKAIMEGVNVAQRRRLNARYMHLMDAYAAAVGLRARLGSEFRLTPASMYAVVLPLYATLTNRVVPAQGVSNTGLFGALPAYVYRAVSSAATAIDKADPVGMSLFIAANLSPENRVKMEYARKKEKLRSTRASLENAAGKPAGSRDEMRDIVAGQASDSLVTDSGQAKSNAQARKAMEAVVDAVAPGTEARSNPERRHSVDIDAANMLDALVPWAVHAGESVEGEDSAASAVGVNDTVAANPNAVSMADTTVPGGEMDQRVAQAAAALGSLAGSWAEVEYAGGMTFILRGRLRGRAGLGKTAVMVVDMSEGGLCDTEEDVRRLATSRAYALSLCAAVNLGDVGGRRFSADDFMRLPLGLREALVRRYNVGAATLSKVAWTVTGKGLATLVGAIRLPASKSGTRLYHEYFHGMMRMFEAVGLLGEADYRALQRRFGKDPTGRRRFDEEAAAEAFRRWVEGQTDADAKTPRSVFRKIFDALKALYAALRHGFSYSSRPFDEEAEGAGDMLFSLAVHGIAAPSAERLAEARQKGRDRVLAEEEIVDATIASAFANSRDRLGALFDAEPSAMDFMVAETQALAQEFRQPVGEASDASVGELMDAAVAQLRAAPAPVEGKAPKMDRVARAIASMLGGTTIADPEDIRTALGQYAAQRAEEAGEEAEAPQTEAPAENEAFDFAPGDVEAEVRAETAKFPRTKTSEFHAAADFIATAIEHGFGDAGKWSAPLERFRDRLAMPTRGSESEWKDFRTAVIQGIRIAAAQLNPAFAKTLSDERIMKSLVYEAVVRAYDSLEQSLVRQTGGRNGEDASIAANPVQGDLERHASRYQVSAWILSSRPTCPSKVAADALERCRAALADAEANPAGADVAVQDDVVAELEMHAACMERLVGILDDATKLLDYRLDGGMRTLNDVIMQLKAGTKTVWLDDGTPTIAPIDVDDPDDLESYDSIHTHNPYAPEHLRTLLHSYRDSRVQESLETALTAAYQVAAMAKMSRELDAVPSSTHDIYMRDQILKRHHLPPGVTVAELTASLAIGDSNLADNKALVDIACQPCFISFDPDMWLASHVRQAFRAKGGMGEALSALNHEFAAVKSRITDLDNFIQELLGMDGEDGTDLLRVHVREERFAFEKGAIRAKKTAKKYVKFDRYGGTFTDRGGDRQGNSALTPDERRMVHLFLLAIAAQRGGGDFVLTGVDRAWFDATMLDGISSFSEFAAKYSRDRVEARYRGEETDESGSKVPMDSIDLMLHRLYLQLGEKTVDEWFDLRNRFLSRAYSAMVEARDTLKVTTERDRNGRPAAEGPVRTGAGSFNSFVLDALEKAGVLAAVNTSGSTYSSFRWLPRYTTGTFKISCRAIFDQFKGSTAYKKLAADERGWKAAGIRAEEWLDPKRIGDEYMAVYGEAAALARRHPWLVHGDGKYFNGFGTALPFWRGSGAFMYGALRANRDLALESGVALTSAESALAESLAAEDRGAIPIAEIAKSRDGYKVHKALLDMLADRFGVKERGGAFLDAIARGDFAAGTNLSRMTGLELGADATVADAWDALRRQALDNVMRIATGERKGSLRDEQRLLDRFEARGDAPGELFGGSTGISDERMYRATGVLPANMQIGHKVHAAIDGIANALSARSTLVTFLMTPASDGAPMYYARPSDLAPGVGESVPDAVWAHVAKWWDAWNADILPAGRRYDPKESGRENARRLFDALRDIRKLNNGRIGVAGYGEVAGDDNDIASVDAWMAHDGTEDDRADSTALNSLAKGEAMGYLRQFIQASRVAGMGGSAVRAVIQRSLAWSKALSVSYSFFFPLATKWESPVGAVGAMATIASNFKAMGELARKCPGIFNWGKGWITRDFLGSWDVRDMMDSNDPFLSDLKRYAHMLGLTLSDSLVNPLEAPVGDVAADIRRVRDAIARTSGQAAAAKFARMADSVLTRHGEKAFTYALNATKLAVAAQFMMKLRHQAEARGKAFDPVRDVKRYAQYLNAEIGGVDPLRYAWMHPALRRLMNILFFSWQWTRGAWEAGGGKVVEDALLGGHSATAEERSIYLARWLRMYGTIMIGLPMVLQAASLAAAKAIRGMFGLPPDDDEGKWWTFQNEGKVGMTAFDITPLLRAIRDLDDTRLGDALRTAKLSGEGTSAAAGALAGGALGLTGGGNWLTGFLGAGFGAAIGSVAPRAIPMYTGADTANRTGSRRYYMHFGKQGWEFYRWFDDGWSQLFSKLSMPIQRLTEGVLGRSLSYLERPLPWDAMGPAERWLSLSRDSAGANLLQAWLPFSLGGLDRSGDAGLLTAVGPVQMGVSQTAVQKKLVAELKAWALNDRKAYAFAFTRRGKETAAPRGLVAEVLHDAELNGLDPKKQLSKASGQVLRDLYSRMRDLIPKRPSDPFDAKEFSRVVRAIYRAGGTRASAMQSVKNAAALLEGKGWKALPPEERLRVSRLVRDAFENPYSEAYAPPRDEGGY